MARVMFLTCHLSGSGHLVRTLILAAAVRSLGHDVTVLNGGRPLGHLAVDPEPVQLPPVTIRGLEFGTLRRPDGQLADDAYMAMRRAAIAEAMRQAPPDVLLTELFPFGRRVLADEFAFALDQARRVSHGVRVVCSVRDIPEPKPKRFDETADRLRNGFDGVLVHGCAQVVPLTTIWPLPPDVLSLVHHVGYIGRSMPDVRRGDTVLVSTGGGVLGRDLARLAVSAAARSQRPWRVLIGGADAGPVAEELRAGSAGNVAIEPARRDFPELLAGAACSISLAGYNTAVELLQTRTPAILIPSTEGDEKEQTLRAGALGKLAGFVVSDLATLTPDTLAANADRLASGPPRPHGPVTVDQGQRAAAVIDTLIQAVPE